MKPITLLVALLFVVACTEGPVAPAAELDGPDLARGANKTAFTTQLQLVGYLSVPDRRITPAGVMHSSNVVVEYSMTGDLEGSMIFDGRAHINLNTGHGNSVGETTVIVTSPLVGTFLCRGASNIRAWGTADMLQSFTAGGCHGSGDYEGMLMKARGDNDAYPGTFGVIYDMWGEIW